jgi:murein L,D-transpeptidase YcbB/YkuD
MKNPSTFSEYGTLPLGASGFKEGHIMINIPAYKLYVVENDSF